MDKIDLQELKTNDQITMYNPDVMDWEPITVKRIGLNYVLIGDDWSEWKESLENLQNTDLYRKYIPPPPLPPKKKPFMYRLLKKWGWT